MINTHKIDIQDNYKGYTPPSWVRATVIRLIDGIPADYLNGLRTISLTNSDGLNHHRRRQKTKSRKRKVAARDCQGLYHHQCQGQQATIELFIDKIAQRWPSLILKVPMFQDLLLSDELFHEIGHHIHKTSAPEHREREDVAEDWRKKLGRQYARHRYSYLRPYRFFLKPIVVFLSMIVNFIRRRIK